MKPNKNKIRWLGLSLALGWLGAVSALAATTNVSIGDDFFSPTNVTINASDSVIWTWVGSVTHSSTSDSGDATMWNSGVHAGGLFSFTNQFPTAGTFTYHCSIHSFMMARVVVQSAGPISLTAPQVKAPSEFQFFYSANVGLTYIVQQSFDLLDWSPIATNLAQSTTVTFTDTNAAAGLRFYRVGLKPNP